MYDICTRRFVQIPQKRGGRSSVCLGVTIDLFHFQILSFLVLLIVLIVLYEQIQGGVHDSGCDSSDQRPHFVSDKIHIIDYDEGVYFCIRSSIREAFFHKTQARLVQL